MTIALVCLGLVGIATLCTFVHSSGYRHGFEDGLGREQWLARQAKYKLNNDRLAAEQALDYLYERTRRQINDLN